MQINSIEINNILSIEEASLSFKDSGLTLVEGWNYDTDRANGAGKTALFNCVAFALYDEMPRKITASEILKRGAKKGYVKCEITVGNDVWQVVRNRPKGVTFFKNNIQQEITQEEFEANIRLTYKQFMLTVYAPQSNSKDFSRFLDSPDALKKEFLLQLLNLNQFDSAKQAADKMFAQYQASITSNIGVVSNLTSRKESYAESLIDKASISLQIEHLSKEIVSLSKQIEDLSITEKPDLSKYASLEDSIKVKLKAISEAKISKAVATNSYKSLSARVSTYDPNILCSECGASTHTELARQSHDHNQKNIADQLAAAKETIKDANVILAKEDEVNSLHTRLLAKKQEDSQLYQDSQLEISRLNSLISNNKINLAHLDAKLKNNDSVLNKISEIDTLVEKASKQIEVDRVQADIYKTLSSFYSSTGAQAYVLDSIVDSFNSVIQGYIDKMSSDMDYTLNSFKENIKGNITAKFSETLTKGGWKVSVGSLSGGEQKGLSLCIDFALLEILESQFGMKLNPIVLDEPFNGLDETGREIVINLLERLAEDRQILVVDHASEGKTMFTDCIRVELRGGTSSIRADS